MAQWDQLLSIYICLLAASRVMPTNLDTSLQK
jgi:hypothetical protein